MDPSIIQAALATLKKQASVAGASGVTPDDTEDLVNAISDALGDRDKQDQLRKLASSQRLSNVAIAKALAFIDAVSQVRNG